jgi:hypothetical protein
LPMRFDRSMSATMVAVEKRQGYHLCRSGAFGEGTLRDAMVGAAPRRSAG